MPFIVSFILSFAATFLVGQLLIPLLRRVKAGQAIKEIGPKWHMSKQGTPTMGGLMFILGIGMAVVIAGWKEMMAGSYTHLVVYLFALVFGVIGFLDDFEKVAHHQNTGLSAPQKFLLQLTASIVFTLFLHNIGYLQFELYIPFLNITILDIPQWLYIIFATFVMVGTVNSVNLTDGIDGLAAGVTMPVALFYVAASAWYGYQTMGIFAAALAGGLAAFLIYNFHPAKVFMGDTGSLFLGGTVCGLAFALNIPLVLPIIGIIYVAETLSDIIQVTYFKLTHGKRIFRMAPLHHHLEMGGWSEIKLFCVFSGITMMMCILAFWGIMDRMPM